MAEPIDKILVPVAEGIIGFVGGEGPSRTDRAGIVQLRWAVGVTAKISVSAIGDHKMIRITVDGCGKTVSFEGSSVSQAVRSAGKSIQRRVERAGGGPNGEHDTVRAAAIATVARVFPEVSRGDGLPKTSIQNAIALYFNAFGTVDIVLPRLSNLSPERAGALARVLYDQVAEIVDEDTTEIDMTNDARVREAQRR